MTHHFTAKKGTLEYEVYSTGFHDGKRVVWDEKTIGGHPREVKGVVTEMVLVGPDEWRFTVEEVG